MYRNKKIGIVVPAYNEETQIERTVQTMPEYVDRIIVIDDLSRDRTVEIVQRLEKEDNRVLLIQHEKNGGVGKAIGTGYIWCRENDIDIAVVMAGDGQMDPDDMPGLLDPVVEDRADYTKGNRLITGEAWKKIPRVRYLGNSALTLLTKIASGYWHVTDSQTGYTALNSKAIHMLPLEDIYPRYGMPNDFLVTCNIYNMRVMDVPIKPVYDIGEESGIKITKVLFSLPLLLIRLFSRRMIQKYIIRDFHPLIFFYTLGFVLILVDIPLIIRLVVHWISQGFAPPMTALAILFCTIMAMQSILFAMLFDMEANRDLKGD